MAVRPGIFPTFFLSGFECSTFRWKDRGRRDLTAETQHREYAHEDYGILRSLGIAVAREGIPWPMVDSGGRYDFTSIEPLIAAMNEAQILPIWDLCHYGYPDELDPFRPDFVGRFAAYCRAAAEYVTARVRGLHFFTPVNEITFWGFSGGEWGWAAPFGRDKPTRLRLRHVLRGCDCRCSRDSSDLFPAVDMPNWHTGEWLHNGICDLVDEGGKLRRVPFQPFVEELHRWQRLLNRVTTLDQDPFSDPVELQDVVDAARRLQVEPDKNWS